MKQIYIYHSLWHVLKSLMAGGLIMLIFTANRHAFAGYQPPSDAEQSSSGNSTITGVRSCGATTSDLNLLALAPRHHVGQTAFTHPTFVWFVPTASEFPVQFELYAVDSSGTEPEYTDLLVASLASTPGIMTFSLPESEPGLTPGGRYVWQVIMICDEDEPSSRSITRAELRVASQLVGTSLNPAVPDSLEVANRYAESGFWYDALGLVSLNVEDASLQMMKASLLEDLAAIEAASEALSSTQGGISPFRSRLAFSEQLRLIAE